MEVKNLEKISEDRKEIKRTREDEFEAAAAKRRFNLGDRSTPF